MDTATCPTCDQQVTLTRVFSWPDGWVVQLANHPGPDGQVSCPGSHDPEPETATD